MDLITLALARSKNNGKNEFSIPYESVETSRGIIFKGGIRTYDYVITDLATANSIKEENGTRTVLEALFTSIDTIFYGSNQIWHNIASNITSAFNKLIEAGCVTSFIGSSDYYVCPPYVDKNDMLGWLKFRLTYLSSNKQLAIMDGENPHRVFLIDLTDGSIIRNNVNKFDTTLTQTDKPADAAAVGEALKLRPTEERVQELINETLGVIENGYY